ncbi:glutamate-1-semialdehyde 2,1-aminomutase [Fluviispira multicolorata]|uniref:Glutamate-1-semialdehyde 2,1-aminomutase n=2 Tax=Fluviispira multicolorata TaxID=2654512 RepID=A0A833JFP0_9BACT|nr:glutamate-1-semialdehyde 2,1-aminomutase [Fluviispira multicolorata]
MERSQRVFPGGVNSPVRSFQSVGGTPIVFSSGKGKYLYDVDGNEFIDFCASWGPLIVGYSHPAILSAMEEQLHKAVTFGAPSDLEVRLAEKVIDWVPGLEMLRFVSSGTEATMSAVRAARAATGKNKFIKFEGCYHGHADQFLVKAGSGLATLGNPSSAGVPEGTISDTLTAIYNSEESVNELFEKFGNEIAAVIIEPVAANMGLVLPKPGFLQFLRKITEKFSAVLIFDEVMTGFRLARGGCAELFSVQPDMWTFGKIIGGGVPAAAYGGKKEIMQQVAPLGAAYQAGTLSGNPLAMVAGYATLCEIEKQSAFNLLEKLGQKLDSIVETELKPFFEKEKICYVREGSFFCFFFGTNKLPNNFSEVAATNMTLFNKVYHAWIKQGIYLGPSGYEVGFLSTCIEESDLKKMVNVVKDVLMTEE